MEIRPTFFSVSGFLAPGIVTGSSAFAIWIDAHPEGAAAVLQVVESHKMEGVPGTIVGIIILAALLSATFVLGSVLSDAFNLVGRSWILRMFVGSRLHLVDRLFDKQSLDELLAKDLTPREAFVYMHTCGIDLHWHAGRVRMVGGSALGLMLVSIYALSVDSCRVSAPLFAGSLLLFALALHRSYRFDKYVAGTAAVLRFIKPGLSADKTEAAE